jgi:hypothetical protein
MNHHVKQPKESIAQLKKMDERANLFLRLFNDTFEWTAWLAAKRCAGTHHRSRHKHRKGFGHSYHQQTSGHEGVPSIAQYVGDSPHGKESLPQISGARL